MKNIDWTDISYLTRGNKRQKESYRILIESAIFEVLTEYSPILVGTIPIGIDIANSDLDIICCTYDLNIFEKKVQTHYSGCESFSHYYTNEVYVANFRYRNTEIEIYAKNKPTNHQEAYMHMIIEYRILNILGESFKQQIVDLKSKGYKTEPAFGLLLNLKDPYIDLLTLSQYSDKELKEYITQ